MAFKFWFLEFIIATVVYWKTRSGEYKICTVAVMKYILVLH